MLQAPFGDPSVCHLRLLRSDDSAELFLVMLAVLEPGAVAKVRELVSRLGRCELEQGRQRDMIDGIVDIGWYLRDPRAPKNCRN